MQGVILSAGTAQSLILGDDGLRYTFSPLDWQSGDKPILRYESELRGSRTPSGGRFAAISAGFFHTCGLLEDGEALCWGNNEYGQSTPPAGRFAAISAGFFHTCGLLEDDEALCWGSDGSVSQRRPLP